MYTDEMIEIIYQHILPYVEDDDVDMKDVLACAFSEIDEIVREDRKKAETYHKWYAETHD